MHVNVHMTVTRLEVEEVKPLITMPKKDIWRLDTTPSSDSTRSISLSYDTKILSSLHYQRPGPLLLSEIDKGYMIYNTEDPFHRLVHRHLLMNQYIPLRRHGTVT
jgi:hypothetical protein